MELSFVLKKIRLIQDITQEELASIFMCDISDIQALENGYYNKFIIKKRIKKLLKLYSKKFDLNYKYLLELYNNNLKDYLKNRSCIFLDAKNFNCKNIFFPSLIKYFLVLVFVLSFGFYFSLQIRDKYEPPLLQIINPIADYKTNNNKILVYGKSVPETSLTINDKEIYVDDNGNFSSEISLHKGVNILKFIAFKKGSKENVIIKRVFLEEEGQIAKLDKNK
jgi:cytoskeletal protein RodZ